MSRLKISAISYLNTAPLLWDFEHGGAGADFELSYTVPSTCAKSLKAGTADIGIIPAAAYADIPDLAIIPDVAIASKRAVRSILLISEVPIERVRTVALDTSSLTSVALIQVLFARWLGGPRQYVPMEPDLTNMLKACDGALLIGDPALRVDRARYVTLDLAEEWSDRTGKPFVFAFWAIRKQALLGRSANEIARTFKNSRDNGLKSGSLDTISRDWSPRLDLPEEAIRCYLTKNIHYYLDAPALEGLELFYRYAADAGILPARPRLQYAA